MSCTSTLQGVRPLAFLRSRFDKSFALSFRSDCSATFSCLCTFRVKEYNVPTIRKNVLRFARVGMGLHVA